MQEMPIRKGNWNDEESIGALLSVSFTDDPFVRSIRHRQLAAPPILNSTNRCFPFTGDLAFKNGGSARRVLAPRFPMLRDARSQDR